MKTWVSFFIALAATSFVLALSETFGGSHPTARVLLSVALMFHVNLLITAMQGRSERIFSLVFNLFMINLLVLPGIIQCSRGYFPFFAKSYPDDLVTKAAITQLAFSFTFWLGCLVMPRRQPSTYAGPRYEIDPRLAWAWIGGFSAVALLGFAASPAIFTTRRGDITELVFDPTPLTVLRTAFVRYSGYFAFLIALCTFLRRKSPGFAMMLPVTFAIAVLVNNPLNIPRFPLIALVICSIFVLFDTAKQSFKVWFASIYTAGLVTVFPLLSTLSRGARGTALFTDISSYYGSSGDFDGFQSIINVTYWIDNEGLKWGNQLISAIFVFIPRDWWPTKGLGTGGVAAGYAGYPFTNISAPLPSEIYSDFGMVGVVLAGALIGCLIAWLDGAADYARGNLGKLAQLGAAAGFTAILLRGSLIGVIGPSGLAIVMGGLLGYVVYRPARAKRQARPMVGDLNVQGSRAQGRV